MASREELLVAVEDVRRKLDGCKEMIESKGDDGLGFFESRTILKNLKKAGGYL